MYAPLLKKIACHLDRARIPYMLIGGQGVLLYGEPRLTQDVDVTLGIDLSRLSELVSTVREMGFELLVDDVDGSRRDKKMAQVFWGGYWTGLFIKA